MIAALVTAITGLATPATPTTDADSATPGLGNPTAHHPWIDLADTHQHHNPKHGPTTFALDRGRTPHQPLQPGGTKLVALSTLTGQLADTWAFDLNRELEVNSDLSDLVLDAQAHFAYIQDTGTHGLLILNLQTRQTHTAMRGHLPGDATLELSADGQWLRFVRGPGFPSRRLPTTILRDHRFDDKLRSLFFETLTPTTPTVAHATADH